jgi:hypothetical protein
VAALRIGQERLAAPGKALAEVAATLEEEIAEDAPGDAVDLCLRCAEQGRHVIARLQVGDVPRVEEQQRPDEPDEQREGHAEHEAHRRGCAGQHRR